MGLEVRMFPYEWISHLGGVPVFVQNWNPCVQVCWGDIICVFFFHPCNIVEFSRAFPSIIDNIPEVFKELCFQGVYQRWVNNPWSFVYMQFVLDQGEVTGCFNCANLDYTRHPEIPDLFSIEWSNGQPGCDITRLLFQNAELPGRERLSCRHLAASSGSPGLANRWGLSQRCSETKWNAWCAKQVRVTWNNDDNRWATGWGGFRQGRNQNKSLKKGEVREGQEIARTREGGKAVRRGEGWHDMACAEGVCGALGRGGRGRWVGKATHHMLSSAVTCFMVTRRSAGYCPGSPWQ